MIVSKRGGAWRGGNALRFTPMDQVKLMQAFPSLSPLLTANKLFAYAKSEPYQPAFTFVRCAEGWNLDKRVFKTAHVALRWAEEQLSLRVL